MFTLRTRVDILRALAIVGVASLIGEAALMADIIPERGSAERIWFAILGTVLAAAIAAAIVPYDEVERRDEHYSDKPDVKR